MDLTLNPINFVLHLALYLGVLLIMKFLYVDPVLRLLKRRDQLTEGRVKSSSELQAKTKELRANYDQQLSNLKSELESKRAAGLRTIQKELDEKLKKHQKDIDAKIQANHAKLQTTAYELRKQVSVLGEGLGRDMADAVMTGKVVRA